MSKTRANPLDFYDYYAKRDFWMEEEAVALALNINPKDIRWIDGALRNAARKKYDKEICTKYHDLMELVEHTLRSGKIFAKYIDNGYGDKYLCADSLSFINWCKTKDISFPTELEKLVIKYTPNYIDWETKYKNLESKVQELETKNIKLIQETSSLPHTRRLISWQKGFIGMLAVKYGHERLLRNFGNTYNKPEINDKIKLTYARIRDDLNIQGISLDDEVIKGLIQESIKYLPQKS